MKAGRRLPVLLLWAAWGSVCPAGRAQPAALSAGEPLRVELAAGASADYRLPAGPRVWRISLQVVEGPPPVLAVADPSGGVVLQVDCSLRTPGARSALAIADSSGDWRIALHPPNTSPLARVYQLRAEDLGPPNHAARLRLAAEQAMAEGDRAFLAQSAGYLSAALQHYQDAAAQFALLPDPRLQAEALIHAGVMQYQLAEMSAARTTLNAALALARGLPDSGAQSAALYGLGLVAVDTGAVADAIDLAQKSLALRRAAGDRFGEAEVLVLLGSAYFTRSQNREGQQAFDQALAAARASGDRPHEADALDFSGVAAYGLGQYEQARSLYTAALAIARAENDRVRSAQALANLGGVERATGDPRAALAAYQEALALRRAFGNPQALGNTLYNLGVCYSELGEYQPALDASREALDLWRKAGNPRGEGFTAQSIGTIYHLLGQDAPALQYFETARRVWNKVGDKRGEAICLDRIGALETAARQWSQAQETLGRALSLATAGNARREQAQTLAAQGALAAAQKQPRRALALYGRSLAISRALHDRITTARTLGLSAAVWRTVGENEKAESALQESANICHALEDPAGESLALAALARLDRDRGRLPDAAASIRRAIALIEEQRTTVADDDARLSFSSARHGMYALAIDILSRTDPTAALEMSERARARDLLDLLAEAGAEIREGVDPALLERQRRVREQLQARAALLTRLLAGPPNPTREKTLRAEIARLADELDRAESDIRTHSPRYASLTQPAPLAAGALQSQVLDSGTLLLEYSLGDKRSLLWALSDRKLEMAALPPESALEPLVHRAYEALTAPGQTVPGETLEQRAARLAKAQAAFDSCARELSGMLLKPVAGALAHKRLIIVADGALLLLPFAALPDPADGLPLAAGHELAALPSASVLALLRRDAASRSRAPKTLAVFGDPVFSTEDERVPRAAEPPPPVSAREAPDDEGEVFPRLRYSRAEALGVAALAPSAEVWLSLGFGASRAALLSPQLADYRIVHLATHAVINNSQPELSGIVLSMVDRAGRPQDGLLRLPEIYNLKLNADLVVLSGCRTALGRLVEGEGLVGLTRGFMYAGTPRVAASLWSVDDAATAALMERFLRGILRGGMPPAAALRAAQLSIRRNPQWSAPFYWAGFVLEGDWR